MSLLENRQLLTANHALWLPGQFFDVNCHHYTKSLFDLLDAVDRYNAAIVALLDLYAAFDAADHSIYLKRLNIRRSSHATPAID